MNVIINPLELLWNDFDEKTINAIISFVDGKYKITKENGLALYISSIAIMQFVLNHEEYLPLKFTEDFTDELAGNFADKAENILQELKKLGLPIYTDY